MASALMDAARDAAGSIEVRSASDLLDRRGAVSPKLRLYVGIRCRSGQRSRRAFHQVAQYFSCARSPVPQRGEQPAVGSFRPAGPDASVLLRLHQSLLRARLAFTLVHASRHVACGR